MKSFQWLFIFSLIVLVIHPASAVENKLVETKLSPQASYIQSGNSPVKFFAAKVEESTSLRVVLAHDQVDGKKETVASMCQRTHCIAGVNGDFFGGVVAHGGLILRNHIIRTPDVSSGQAWIGQGLEERPAAPNLPIVQLADGKKQLWPINIAPVLNKSSIYTNAYGGELKASLESPILIYQCLCQDRPDRAGKTYQLKLVGNIASGILPRLSRNQIGLRMPAASIIVFIAVGKTISLKLPKVRSAESIGAHPVLLRNSKIIDLRDPFALSLHPRTVFGCNEAGQCWLIAIDTKVTLEQAAKIARRLGVTEGINMDGGGSTTFVVHGRTLNSPADKAEREVASAILVVKNTTNLIIKAKDLRQKVPRKDEFAFPPSRSLKKPLQISFDKAKILSASPQYVLSAEQGGNPVFGLGSILILIALIVKRASIRNS